MQKEQRREEILCAAREVFAQKGYYQTNIADVAALLGMGHGTFYRYFQNKRDIFRAVLERIIGDVTRIIDEEDPGASDTLEEYSAQLARIGARLFAVFFSDGGVSRLLFQDAPSVDGESAAQVEAAMDVLAQNTARYIANGVKKGFLCGDLDILRVARVVNAMAFEAIRQVSRAEDHEAERDAWIRVGVGLVIRGLAA